MCLHLPHQPGEPEIVDVVGLRPQAAALSIVLIAIIASVLVSLNLVERRLRLSGGG